MTVRDLIDILEEYDEGAEIFMSDTDSDIVHTFYDIGTVYHLQGTACDDDRTNRVIICGE